MPLPEVSQPDRLLESYVLADRRSAHDFALLIQTEGIDEQIKERAIEILLAPDLKKLPFSIQAHTPRYWNNRNYLADTVKWREVLRGRTDLAILAASLVVNRLRAVSSKGSDHDNVSSRYQYQGIILQLLPMLPPEEADELFSHFDVNTKATWDNFGDNFNSPYLLRQTLGDPNIPEAYKRRVADSVHQIIEKKGFLGIGDKKEERATKYAEEIGDIIEREVFRRQEQGKTSGSLVGDKFLREEITYLVGIETGEQIFHSWTATAEGIKLLGNTELGHRFLRRQFLSVSDEPRFTDDLKQAQRAYGLILAFFPEDRELRAAIQAKFKDLREEENIEKGRPRRGDFALIEKMKTG